MILLVTVPPAHSLRLNAANTLGIAVIADSIVVLIGILAAVGAVIAFACAVIADPIVIAVSEGTVLCAVIAPLRIGAAVTSAAVSAVSGSSCACHRCCRSGSQDYG